MSFFERQCRLTALTRSGHHKQIGIGKQGPFANKRSSKNNFRFSDRYLFNMFPYVAPYLLPTLNTLMTCSVYGTIAVALNRYLEMTEKCRNTEWMKNGKLHCLLVVIISVVFNFTRWFELEYVVEKIGEDFSNMTETGNNVTLKVMLQIARAKDMIISILWLFLDRSAFIGFLIFVETSTFLRSSVERLFLSDSLSLDEQNTNNRHF